jgi:hypothetical protein
MKIMSISDDFYASACDDSVDTRAWILNLRDTHSRRAMIQRQTEQFYFRRRLIEYAVKATITASMAIAIIWGGPPVWIIGGAALMLRISALILNRFNPSQYVKDSAYSLNQPSGDFVEENRLESFRCSWINGFENNELAIRESNLCALQTRIGFALVTGFVIFSVLNANLTLAVILASFILADSLIHQAHEVMTPYVEEEEALSNLFVH